MPEPTCPAHKSGLKVTVTERGGNSYPCRCGLQAGHPGECEPGHG